MELRQLRYFVAIVDHASLSHAARQLGVAQPALSQHVRHMEEELCMPLLNRNARGVTPTDAGKRLYTSARSILTQVAELPDLVREAMTNPVGDVHFGMSGTVSELVGVPLLEAAKGSYPGIRIRLVEAMSGHVLDWLRRGDIDLALVYATSDPQGLEIHHVLTENLCLFGRPGGPITARSGSTLSLRAVAAQKLIIPAKTHGLRQLVDTALAGVGNVVEPVFEVDSYNHIKRLARSGMGYAILPQTAIAGEVKAGIFDYWQIGKPPLRRSIYLTRLSSQPRSAAVAVVAELALAVTRKLVREGIWIADEAPND